MQLEEMFNKKERDEERRQQLKERREGKNKIKGEKVGASGDKREVRRMLSNFKSSRSRGDANNSSNSSSAIAARGNSSA